MPELVFFSGTMDCGKSTLALQITHNRSARGLQGVIFTRQDRAGEGKLSSRLGLVTEAIEAPEGMDLYAYVVAQLSQGGKADYVIVDEAQFLAPEQIDQLARIVDDLDMDVFAFGITTDFRTKLFPGSQRLIELADRLEQLQVEACAGAGRARRTTPVRWVGDGRGRRPGGRRRRQPPGGAGRLRGPVPAPPPPPDDLGDLPGGRPLPGRPPGQRHLTGTAPGCRGRLECVVRGVGRS